MRSKSPKFYIHILACILAILTVLGCDILTVQMVIENHKKDSVDNAQLEDSFLIDMSNYPTKAEIAQDYQPKGDYLTEHQPIKNVNGQEMVGDGNVDTSPAPEIKTIEGLTLTVSDAKEGAPISFEAYGFTEAFGKSKNLFDLAYASVFANYKVIMLGDTNRRVITFDLEPNTTYTFYRTQKSGVSNPQNMALYNSDGNAASILNHNSRSITTGDDGKLYFGTTATAFTSAAALKFHKQYENIQLVKGTTVPPYEPYRDHPIIINAGVWDEDTQTYSVTLSFESVTKTQTVTIPLQKPLSKWDRLVKKDGVWGISYQSERIEGYNDEVIPSEFVSSTGALNEGAWVQYKTEAETFVALNSDLQDVLNAIVLDDLATQITNDSKLTFSISYEMNEDVKIQANSIYVNVKDFGARGDGVTDDTAAIRAARDLAKLTKKILYFPAGTYVLSGCIQLYSDMHVVGAKGSTLTKRAAVVQKLAQAGAVGDTTVYVSDASQYKVGQDIYIGANGSGNYADTVGYITEIDTQINAITFKVYPRHSADPNAGLAREVKTSGVVSTSFPLLCTFRMEDAGGNIKIEGLTLDGNKLPSGEPNAYQLSMIHIDPNQLNVTVRDCKVINSNADGISLQNAGQTTVDNCIINTTGYHGIHPGFTIRGVAISNCYIYNCPDSGIYDCYDVDGFDVSNCYFVNCKYGIGGLDVESNGSNIVACTFVNCYEGVYLRATNGGASVTGCSFQNCTVGVNGYVSGTAAVTGCAFVGCNNAALFVSAWNITFTGNIIRECALPIECRIYENKGTIKKSANLIISDNIISSTGTNTSKIVLCYLDVAIVKGNILTGNDATINVDTGTTTGITIESNVGEKSEFDSTASA